jgi:hypothetical protein
MIRNQRGSLLCSTVDMCVCLKRNSEFVDLTQCEEIAEGDLQNHVPKFTTFSTDEIPDDSDEEEDIAELFSQASMDDLL